MSQINQKSFFEPKILCVCFFAFLYLIGLCHVTRASVGSKSRVVKCKRLGRQKGASLSQAFHAQTATACVGLKFVLTLREQHNLQNAVYGLK